MGLTNGHCYGISQLICLKTLWRHILIPRLMLEGICVTCQACIIRCSSGDILLPMLWLSIWHAAYLASGCCDVPLCGHLACILHASLLCLTFVRLTQHTDATCYLWSSSAGVVANRVSAVHLWCDSHPCSLLHSHSCVALCRLRHRNSGFLGCQCLSFSRCDRSSGCYGCSCPPVLVL